MSSDGTSEGSRGRNAGTNGLMGGGYGLGFIGAAVYFVQHAHTLGQGILGVLKAIVWPAILAYGLLEHIGM